MKAAVIFALIIAGCGLDSMSEPHHSDPDANSSMDMDVGDVDPDTPFSVSDVGIPDLGEVDPRGAFAPDLYMSDRTSCTEVQRVWTVSEEPFTIPERVSAQSKKTAAEVRRDLAGNELASAVVPAESLRGGHGVPHVLFAQPGMDVEFSFYLKAGSIPHESFEDTKLSLTFMVNLQPVQANYVRWNDERTLEKQSLIDTGVSFAIESDVEIWDIRIPAAVFAQAGAYEIEFAFEFRSRDYGAFGGSLRRMIFYGGYSMDQTICARPQLESDESLWEYYLWLYHLGDDFVGILHDNTPFRFSTPYSTDRGKLVRFYWSMFRLSYPENRYVASVPLLNGRPVGDAIFSTAGKMNRVHLSSEQTVDDRGFFDLRLPDESGVHEVSMATWIDPFVLATDLDNQPVDGDVEWGRRVAEGSNAARFYIE